MAGMANAPHLVQLRRPLAIVLPAFAAVLVVLIGLALWNPWRLTILFPLSHQAVAVGVLVLAGAFVAATALLRFADNGRRALIALVACLVAVPALCVGLPVVALGHAFAPTPVGPTLTMAVSPSGRYAVVKSTYQTAGGQKVQLFVRTANLFLGRQAATPLAECDTDPFQHGVPPESVRFTSETTVALPGGDSTQVVRFDPDTLAPAHPADICAKA
jgi:hypothetical protein